MKWTLSSLSLLLLLLCAVLAIPTGVAQQPHRPEPGPRLGPYGTLIGLTDKNGNDVLPNITRPWREGFAIAYRTKLFSGIRYAYAFDQDVSQLTANEPADSPTTRVLQTSDKFLQITRTFDWNNETQLLATKLTVKNVAAKADVMILRVDLLLDDRVSSFTVDPPCPNYGPARKCPSCSCGQRCKPLTTLAFARDLGTSCSSVVNLDGSDKFPQFRGSSSLHFLWQRSPVLSRDSEIMVSATTRAPLR